MAGWYDDMSAEMERRMAGAVEAVRTVTLYRIEVLDRRGRTVHVAHECARHISEMDGRSDVRVTPVVMTREGAQRLCDECNPIEI